MKNSKLPQPSITRMIEAMDEAAAAMGCSVCIHWKRHPTGEQGNLGDCYLNPPVPFPLQSQHPITGQVSLGLQMFRPITRDTDYCGHQDMELDDENDK